VQEKLGATRAAAFDLNAMCSGFVYGLAVGSQFVRTGAAENILVIGMEVLSSVTDYTDRNTCILFGDAAGAAVLAPLAARRKAEGSAPEPGPESTVGGAKGTHEILYTNMGADGSGFDLIWQPAGGSRVPATPERVAAGEHFLKMNGRAIFKIAVHKFQEAIRDAARAAGWGLDEVDLVVPHQVNTRIIDVIVERIGIAHEKVYQNLERYGNTSAASIPLALWEAEKEGKLAPGDKVVLAAVGGGITWGSVAILW
jgi:3-oxoacyl-[acyl-carrier-protein] synthase-3